MIYKMADGANPQKPRTFFICEFFLPKIACPPFGAGHNPGLEKQGLAFVFIIVLMVP
jgi:hypothetical protein